MKQTLKKCSRCGEIKSILEFTKNKTQKDGYHFYCKDCKHQTDHNSYLKYKPKRKEYNRIYNHDNKNKRQITGRKYYSLNKLNIKLKQLQKRPQINQTRRKHRKFRYQNDLNFQLTCNMRSRVSIALKNNQKFGHIFNLLNCTIKKLRLHLESQFKDGMSWKNYGKNGWHIDHIIPCSSFDLSDPKQQRKCFCYTNLQPLWWWENLEKSNKLCG